MRDTARNRVGPYQLIDSTFTSMRGEQDRSDDLVAIFCEVL